MSTSSSSSGGIGFSGLLTIVFIVLKLTHYIDWPWVWVLSPIWISIVAVLGFFLIFVIIMGIIEIVKSRRRHNTYDKKRLGG